MSIKARLAKLERQGSTGDIPVWCDTEADVPATIRGMVADGELSQADIGRCVHWLGANARNGAHEAALAELSLIIQHGNSE
jgi:hypothetical protein